MLERWFSRATEPNKAETETQIRWSRDPLSHPALATMSQRELADLPIGPAMRGPSVEALCCPLTDRSPANSG